MPLFDVDSGELLYLWADAICINQGDVGERNSQVSLMGDIYSKAQTVWVCVGEPAESWDMEHAQAVAATLYSKASDYAFASDRKSNFIDGIPAPTDGCWRVFQDIMVQPWFSRVWIVQEIILANTSTFLFGSTQWLLQWLWAVSHFLSKLGRSEAYTDFSLLMYMHPNHTHEDGIQMMRNRVSLLYLYDEVRLRILGSSRSLLRLLQTVKQRDCTDPRDKVYAFLGLATTEDWEALIPDYLTLNDTVAVYTKFAQHCIRSGNALQLLYEHDSFH